MLKKKYKLIANPKAGRGRAGGIISKVTRLLRERGAGFDLELTAGPDDARKFAAAAVANDTFDAIVSLGGDGTLNEIVQAAIYSQVPLAVIPAGSGNDFAKALNLPKDFDAVVDVVLAGRTRVIDAGRMNKRYFVNGVGIGFDAAVNYQTRSITWIKAGLAVYFCAFLKTVTQYKPLPMRLDLDGEILDRDLFLVSVGNGTTCGGGFKLTPHAKLDDGLLDITIVTPLSLPQLFYHLPKVFLGTIERTRHALTRRAAKLTITSQHPLPIHVDGEFYSLEGNTCEISVVPKSLTVIGNF